MSDPASAAVQRWALPTVDGPIVGGRNNANQRELEQREHDARAAAEARGYEDGLAAGRQAVEAKLAELDSRVRRLDGLLQLLDAPLEQLDTEVERQLVLLALATGRQLARRELRADPAQVIAVIREALGRLPVAARNARVHLHPEDAAVVRERLAAPSSERAWSIVEDPTLSRGGCVVRTDTSQLDARLESRIEAVVSGILGDERQSGRTDESVGGAPA